MSIFIYFGLLGLQGMFLLLNQEPSFVLPDSSDNLLSGLKGA